MSHLSKRRYGLGGNRPTNKNPRFIRWSEEILYEHGPQTIGDLMLKLKERETMLGGGRLSGRVVKNVPTFKVLSNAVASWPQFIPVGTIRVPSKLNPEHSYRVLIYGLAEGYPYHSEEE